VLRVLRGENVLGMVGIRIRRVLAAHGIVVPERSIVELARPQIGVDRTKVRL
jgi:hypothetical protein